MKFKSKVSSTPHGALAKLWRNVIKDTGIEHTLGYLVTKYVSRNSTDSKNIKRKTRATIEADVTSSELTWKKFLHLVFQYLGARRMDIAITLTYPNGSKSTHSLSVKSSDAFDAGDDDNKE